MQKMDPKRKVESGYDAMARQYLASKDQNDPETAAALDKIAASIPKGAKVLDLGCGGGIPVTRMLVDRGFVVTGVDLSSQQLELARTLVPEATFIKADMTQVAFKAESFSAVVSFYAIIHVPRSEQPDLIRRIYSWLEPGGMFL